MNNVTYVHKTTDDGVAILCTEADGTVWWVPETPGNRHYEEYLEWVAEGNQPEVIDG